MSLSTSRAARRAPLAFTLPALAALAALGACADDPAAPESPSKTAPAAHTTQTLGAPMEVVVTNTFGGMQVGSLRWAASQIRIPDGGIIRFDPSLEGDTIVLEDQVVFEHKAWIDGPARGITLSGNDQHRVILAVDNVSLTNVTITRGNAPTGSAIWAAGSILLRHSTVHNNRGPGSAIDGNGVSLYVVNSTVSGNAVGTAAIDYPDGSWLYVINSTVAHNAPGVGLRMDGRFNPYPFPVRVELNQAIVSGNGSPQRNCATTAGFVYLGTNISNDSSCGTVGVVVADPRLMPLANNGGPTLTHAFPPQSPAFNPAARLCNVDVDQRYVPRDAKCDAGAFEFNDFTQVAITIDNGVKMNTTTGKAMLTGTVTCTRADTFSLHLELHQDQKIGGESVDVHGVSALPVECGTTAKAWTVPMTPGPGWAFQAGAAKAIAQTSNLDTPEWMTPASVTSGVRISFSRK
jgi:hypothetical protein